MIERNNPADGLVRFFTIDETNALDAAAHRARALALRQARHACALTVKALAARLAAATAGKGVSHA
jgi:hypothetical protein